MMTGFELGMGLGGWLWMAIAVVVLVVVVWAVDDGRPDGPRNDDVRAARADGRAP